MFSISVDIVLIKPMLFSHKEHNMIKVSLSQLKLLYFNAYIMRFRTMENRGQQQLLQGLCCKYQGGDIKTQYLAAVTQWNGLAVERTEAKKTNGVITSLFEIISNINHHTLTLECAY